MVHLRASHINGCSVCVEMHARELKEADGPDERNLAVAAWRDAPYFSDAERAALPLTEAATRLSDRADAVPDEIWEEAASHDDEPALTALILEIALINAWNRLNVTTRQLPGEWQVSIATLQPRMTNPAFVLPDAMPHCWRCTSPPAAPAFRRRPCSPDRPRR